jgi:energy-coupling factor transport system permease protein
MHPAAWWLWGLGLATAATRTTNPWLLAIIIGVSGCVVVANRGNEPWARSYAIFFRFGLVIIAIRVLFQALLGNPSLQQGSILFTVPSISLPHWMTGIHLGGPVTAESVAVAFYDGLSLATILCCVGAANTLANTKRLLRGMPGALYEISVALVVALSVAPQLITSAQRAYRARGLRGETRRGMRALKSIVVPVLTDALDHSLMLAAAMDSRGYGRTAAVSRKSRLGTVVLLLSGLCGICIGSYALLDSTTPVWVSVVALIGGLAGGIGGLWLGSRRILRSKYRPNRWRLPDFVIGMSGALAAATMITAESLGIVDLNPVTIPLAAPDLPVIPAIGLLLALTPVWTVFMSKPATSTKYQLTQSELVEG